MRQERLRFLFKADQLKAVAAAFIPLIAFRAFASITLYLVRSVGLSSLVKKGKMTGSGENQSLRESESLIPQVIVGEEI